MESLESRIYDLYDAGYCCAEAVLIAVAEHKGIKSDLIPKIATGFCTGLSKTSGMCGALTGAIVSVNMVLGRDKGDDSAEQNYAVVKQLLQLFEESVGSTNCTSLMGFDLGSEEGIISYYDNNLIEKCMGYSVIAAKIAIELLEAISKPIEH